MASKDNSPASAPAAAAAAAEAPQAAVETAPTAAAAAEAEEAADDRNWDKVLIVAGGTIPTGEKRAIIVVESRADHDLNEDGTVKTVGETKMDGYPTGGDINLRFNPDVEFKGDGQILTLGDNVFQDGFGGFSNNRNSVRVGPTHPAYAAINIAIQRGAKEIEVKGLTKAQKETLAPWLAQDKSQPEGVSIELI